MASRRFVLRPSALRPSALRRFVLRRSRDRGATAVEYALVLSLLAGGSMVVLDAVTDPVVSTLQRQTICSSERPAPTGCHPDAGAQP
jgi:Flp pilus assembly pilin Flp